MRIKHLGVFVDNWSSWQGGRSYIRSFLECAKEYRVVSGARFGIVAVVREEKNTEWLHADAGLVDRVLLDTAEVATQIQTLPERVLAKLFPQMFPERDVRRASFCRRHRLSVLFGCSGRVKIPAYYRSAGYIWDLGHRLAPGEFPPEECEERDKYFLDISRSHQTVILSSETDAAALRKLVPDVLADVVVYSFRSFIPESDLQSDPLEVAREYGLPRKYAIICNQMWKHKRHDLLIRAIAGVRRLIPDLCLVFTGPEETQYHPAYPGSVVALISQLGLKREVIRLGTIPRTSQLALLRGAAFLVQPSVSEGWNTSIEEARMLGKPVLMSDIPVHLEQAFESCSVFAKDDIASLSQELEIMWRSCEAGVSQKEKIAKATYANLRLCATGNMLKKLGIV